MKKNKITFIDIINYFRNSSEFRKIQSKFLDELKFHKEKLTKEMRRFANDNTPRK